MRKRSLGSFLPILSALLVLLGGCIDTAEPEGPVPAPPEDGGGEVTAPTEPTALEDMPWAARRGVRPLREQERTN